ncbi:MAG: hypothetical protein HY293_11875 [Planctomycetes bacterium]|nr:hypothetical protein [Planctomycetota bacterium]
MRKDLRRAGFVSLTLGAIGCGEPSQPDALRPQDLFSKDSVSTDSLNGESWRKYLEAKELHLAWAPPADSPWRPFYKPTLIAAVSVVQSAAMPLKNSGTAFQESQAVRFGNGFNLSDAAVFVDLPGEQSVAWGASLRKFGLQPVLAINNWPHQFGILRLERPLGALIYHAAAASAAPLPAAANPAFLLERSRLGQKGLDPSPHEFDNRFFHPSTDFPSASGFKNRGINRIVYINPRGTTAGSEEDDLNEYFAELARYGLQFTYVKAAPDTYDTALVTPSSRSTIFTKDSIAQYTSSPTYHSHYYHSYPHYSYWHTTYWSRSSGAWGGSGSYSSGGSSGGFSS